MSHKAVLSAKLTSLAKCSRWLQTPRTAPSSYACTPIQTCPRVCPSIVTEACIPGVLPHHRRSLRPFSAASSPSTTTILIRRRVWQMLPLMSASGCRRRRQASDGQPGLRRRRRALCHQALSSLCAQQSSRSIALPSQWGRPRHRQARRLGGMSRWTSALARAQRTEMRTTDRATGMRVTSQGLRRCCRWIPPRSCSWAHRICPASAPRATAWASLASHVPSPSARTACGVNSATYASLGLRTCTSRGIAVHAYLSISPRVANEARIAASATWPMTRGSRTGGICGRGRDEARCLE
jgi:hypothetical protein